MTSAFGVYKSVVKDWVPKFLSLPHGLRAGRKRNTFATVISQDMLGYYLCNFNHGFSPVVFVFY